MSRPAPTHKGETFTAIVWRWQAEDDIVWLQSVEQADEYEDGSPLCRPDGSAPEPYEAKCDVFAALIGAEDMAYPAAIYTVTVDADGYVTAIERR